MSFPVVLSLLGILIADLDFLFAMLALLLVALTLQSLKVHLEV